ncbi:MAG: DUF2490 domain-containing protein [Bacteroidetes bacterium]|nr:MAG: DUF2490 domain-containing protein [Bacteroidota bacterium]
MKKLPTCVFLMFILNAKGQVVEHVQLWNHLHLEHHLNERNTLNYELGYRFQITPFQSKQSLQRISFTRKLNSPFSFGAGIASFEHFKDTGIQWESRLFQDLNHTLKTEKIHWTNRLRLEEKFYWRFGNHEQMLKVRFRYRTGVDIPFSIGKKEAKLGLSDEILVETDPVSNLTYMNRILPNFTVELNDRNSITLMYSHQKYWKDDGSLITPVIWLNYKLKLINKLKEESH